MKPAVHVPPSGPQTFRAPDTPAAGANDNARATPHAAQPPQPLRIPVALMPGALLAAQQILAHRARWQSDLGLDAPDLQPLDTMLPEINACEAELTKLRVELAQQQSRLDAMRADVQTALQGASQRGEYPHLATLFQTLRNRPELDALDGAVCALRVKLHQREGRYDALRAELRGYLVRAHDVYERRARERPTLSGQGGALATLFAAVRTVLTR